MIKRKRVIVEMRVPVGFTMRAAMEMDVAKLLGFEIDPEYEPVPVSPTEKMAANLMAANAVLRSKWWSECRTFFGVAGVATNSNF